MARLLSDEGKQHKAQVAMAEHARPAPAIPAGATAKATWPPAKTATPLTRAAVMLHRRPAIPAKHVISFKHSIFLSIMS
jgi:hypothetical protein